MELFEHQKKGIEFLKQTKKAILADEMGLGKTRQAIVAAGQESDQAVLVICPASLKINWEREIKMVYEGDNVYVVNPGPEYIVETDDSAWIVINYDMLEKYEEQLLTLIKNGVIETIILDEAHYIKGSDTIRSKIALKLSLKAKRVYMLTGTPVMNRPIELFNMLKAIEHPLGKLKGVFVQRFCGGQKKCMIQDLVTGKKTFINPQHAYGYYKKKDRYKVYQWQDDTGAQNLDELQKEIKDVMLRRKKDEVTDLPEKIVSTLTYDLTDDQRVEYDTAWNAYIDWLDTHPDADRDMKNIIGAQQLIEVGKLKQVCSLAKVPRIVADIENAIEQGEKVIVFSQYTQTIERIANSIGNRAVTLTGSDDQDSRQLAVDTFQNDPNCKVFIANIKAGGVGITLTAASIVIFADMDWSPEVHNQAMDRAHRIGQNGTVNVYFYVTKDTIEEKIVELLAEKKDVISKLVQAK